MVKPSDHAHELITLAERFVAVRARLFAAHRGLVPLTAEDALTEIRLARRIDLYVMAGRGMSILDALHTGATWCEVANALGATIPEARVLLTDWIGGQEATHQMTGGKHGMSPAEAEDALVLGRNAPEARS